MSIKFDDTTVAALPGMIKIDKSKFFGYYQITGIGKIYYSIILNSKLEKLNRRFPNNKIVQKWIELNEQFQYGCANPSIIIDKSKGIYASYTDLTNDGGESTPVIKIVQLKNSRLNSVECENNDYTVTVSFYFRHEEDVDARAWIDFEPLLPQLFSKNRGGIERLKEKIKEPAWECLKLGISQIENREKPGLYHVQLPDELTKNAY